MNVAEFHSHPKNCRNLDTQKFQPFNNLNISRKIVIRVCCVVNRVIEQLNMAVLSARVSHETIRAILWGILRNPHKSPGVWNRNTSQCQAGIDRYRVLLELVGWLGGGGGFGGVKLIMMVMVSGIGFEMGRIAVCCPLPKSEN